MDLYLRKAEHGQQSPDIYRIILSNREPKENLDIPGLSLTRISQEGNGKCPSERT